MATPSAAQHRDLEQRFRDLERQVRVLTSRALRREQLNVTQGDFEVSGGGSVIVHDGGTVEVEYPDAVAGDYKAAWMGSAYLISTGAYDGSGVLVRARNGNTILQAMGEVAAAESQIYLADKAGATIFRDDPAGKGLGSPDLAIPLYRADQSFSTTSTTLTLGLRGDATHWQPKILARVQTTAPSGVTARVQLQMNGVIVDTQDAVGGGYLTLSGNIPSFTPGTSQSIELYLRRVNGVSTDTVTMYPINCRGSST